MLRRFYILQPLQSSVQRLELYEQELVIRRSLCIFLQFQANPVNESRDSDKVAWVRKSDQYLRDRLRSGANDVPTPKPNGTAM
jgi:hypothetical protein